MKAFPWMAVLAALTLAPAAHASGDAAAGEKAFRQCKSCHATEPGKHRVGPSLHGVFQRPAGSAEGFANYSDGMKASGIVWDEAKLDAFLSNPKGIIPDSRMAFAGVGSPEDRANLIAFLKSAK